MNSIAKTLADMSAEKAGTTFRHAWTSSASKNPRHLRFANGGQIQYMRDGILTVSNGSSGSYERVKEFSGPNHDEHEVVLKIAGPVFAPDGEILPEGGRLGDSASDREGSGYNDELSDSAEETK